MTFTRRLIVERRLKIVNRHANNKVIGVNIGPEGTIYKIDSLCPASKHCGFRSLKHQSNLPPSLTLYLSLTE